MDLRSERPDLKPERPDLRPEGPDEGGTLCRSNVKTAYNSNCPKSWLLLLRMVDRDQTNMKLEKKIHLGGQGVPGGPQGDNMGQFHGSAIKIIENLDF